MENDLKRELSDSELINSFLGDELSAFEELYGRYRKQLYAYLHRLLPGQHTVVEDIFQQTWIKIIANFEKYRENERFLPWTMRISHNLAVDHFRKYKHEIVQDFSENPQICPSFDYKFWNNIDRKELSDEIEKCIGKLPLEQKEVFCLRQDELSFKEISEIQKCSINTALGRMQYALRNLQNCLSRWRRL